MKIIVVVSRCIHVESSCRICRVEYYVSRGHHGENPWQGSQRGILTYQIFRSSLPLFFLCFLPICSTAYLAKPDSYIFCLVLFLWQLFFLIFFFFFFFCTLTFRPSFSCTARVVLTLGIQEVRLWSRKWL